VIPDAFIGPAVIMDPFPALMDPFVVMTAFIRLFFLEMRGLLLE
jgi:hypothetical protein